MSRVLLIIIAFAMIAQDLCAQDERVDVSQGKTVKAGSLQKKKENQRTKSQSKKNKTIPLLGLDGKPLEVPLDANLQDYLNWLKTKKGSEYAINSISLSGTIKEKYAELRAELTIQLLRDNGWVRIPLTLNEAVLRESNYEGKGEASFDEFDSERGYTWWFRGKGFHKLILDLTVPISNLNSSHRLKLTLPPRVAASSLKLKVPFKKVKPDFGKGAVVETKPLDTLHSEIKVIGLGERIDGRWTSVRESSNLKPVFKVDTSIIAKLSLETAILRVKQKIESINGSAKELFVKIPTSFEVLQVDGDAYRSHRKVSGREGWYAVSIAEPQTEPVILEWTLQSIFDKSSTTIFDLQGFEVQDAVRQKGEIAVILDDGIRVKNSSETDRFVYRIQNRDFRDRDFLQTSTPTESYAFLKQPFRFSRRLEEIKPFLSVFPSGMIEIGPKEAKLSATYHCEIREGKGVVREIPLRWTNWEKHGWKIQSIKSQGLFDDASSSILAKNEEHVLKFRQPQSDDFEFTIRAIRKFEENNDRFEIDFPQVLASKTSSLNLDVKLGDEIEASLSSRDHSKQMEFFRRQGLRQYRIDPGNDSLTFEFSVHEPEVVATNFCSVGIDNDRLNVMQSITHQIRYFRTSTLRLSVPNNILGQLKVFLGNESVPLSIKRSQLDFGTTSQVTVNLPNPVIGTVELLLKYSVKIPLLPVVETPAVCELVFVKSAEREFTHSRLTFQNSDRYRLLVKDSQWQQETSTNGTTAWEISDDVSKVNLELSISKIQTSQRFSVKRALVASFLNRDGSSFHRAQYSIAGFLTEVEMKWPHDAELMKVWWNQEIINAENIRRKNGKDDIIVISVPLRDPFSENRSFLLTVDYGLPQNRKGTFLESHELKFPSFLSPVWIEKTKWIVQLPANLYLGQTPSQFEAGFQWVRRGVTWRRTPQLTHHECADWISAERGPDSIFELRDDHFYLFTRQGKVQTLSLSMISRAKLIFLGAGFALFAGFLFLRMRALQNTLTVLAGCFVLSILGIWFFEWLQLLIQPALLGLLLATMAIGIDSTIRRRRTSVVMTVPGKRDFRAQHISNSSGNRTELRNQTSSTVDNVLTERHISEEHLAASDFSSQS